MLRQFIYWLLLYNGGHSRKYSGEQEQTYFITILNYKFGVIVAVVVAQAEPFDWFLNATKLPTFLRKQLES